MRVLMLIHHVAAAGGSFERSFALARHLVRLGHTVTLSVSPSRASATPRVRELQGVRLVESADVAPFHLRNMGLSPLDILGRMVLATHESFDVVHGFDQRPSVSLPALAQRKRFGSPYVSDWADLWGGQGIAGERSWPARVTLGAFDGACEKRVCQSASPFGRGMKALGVVLYWRQYSSSCGRMRPRSTGKGGSQSAKCNEPVIPG